jgi:hypothetical protein
MIFLRNPRMALEDRIRSSVDTALGELRARLDKDVRAIIQQLVTAAREERDEMLAVVRRETLDRAADDTQRQIEEAEARVRTTIDEAVNEARTDERSKAAGDLCQQLEAAEAKSEQRLKDTVADAQVREREAEMATLARLIESIRGLDGATSLSEVLDALGQAVGREASRAAVFVLRNERLLGWKLSGFGSRDAQPKGIDLGLDDSGVIGQAVAAARPVTTRDSHASAAGPGFVNLPLDRMGFAVPVIMGGRVVAVVYADSVAGDERPQVVPSAWPEVIEILSRHAARCLEVLTVQKPAAAPSPRFSVPGAARPTPAGGSEPV